MAKTEQRCTRGVIFFGAARTLAVCSVAAVPHPRYPSKFRPAHFASLGRTKGRSLSCSSTLRRGLANWIPNSVRKTSRPISERQLHPKLQITRRVRLSGDNTEVCSVDRRSWCAEYRSVGEVKRFSPHGNAESLGELKVFEQ